MPGSKINGKAVIQEWLAKRTDIKTILDIGPGSATYPKLLGDKYNWIGIEIWAPYIKQFELEKYYSNVIVGDISYIDILELPKIDCVIFGDVLEHLPKNRALSVISKYLYYPFFPEHVVISIPIDGSDSKVHYGNNFEKHLSYWEFTEIQDLFKWEVAIHTSGMGIFIK